MYALLGSKNLRYLWRVNYNILQGALVDEVKTELMSWNDTLKEDMMPKDPIEFSHWLTANLPLDDTLKFRLLWINNAVQRLRCQLSIMHRVKDSVDI